MQVSNLFSNPFRAGDDQHDQNDMNTVIVNVWIEERWVFPVQCMKIWTSRRRFKPTCQIVVSALLGNLSACSDDPQESTATRVPGLPTRNCAGSSNNLVPRGTKMSAIDVTSKVFFERLYWFQDWAHLSPESTVRVLPHPHCSLNNYFSISVQFFRMWPLIFVSTRFTK